MKKTIGLLALVLITALITGTVTFFVVSGIDSARREREHAKYEEEIAKLEATVAQLQKAASAQPIQAPQTTANGPGTEATRTSSPQPAQPAPAATSRTRYSAATSGSKCRIEGTSSIHPWKMEGVIIGGFFELDSNVKLDPAQATLAGVSESGIVSAAAEASMPVRSLKSYSTKMDEVYQDQMEAITYRRIEYRLKELALKRATHAPNTPFEFDSKGDLVIHGVTNTLAMPVKIERLDANRLKITGSTALKMSAYKVQPPCPTIPGLGQITTGDDITVTFEWIVALPTAM